MRFHTSIFCSSAVPEEYCLLFSLIIIWGIFQANDYAEYGFDFESFNATSVMIQILNLSLNCEAQEISSLIKSIYVFLINL